MRILASTDRSPTGEVYRHVSLSHPSRFPTWDEIKALREIFFRPESTVVQILPPVAEYVNLHENCFHLWERLEGPVEWPEEEMPQHQPKEES